MSDHAICWSLDLFNLVLSRSQAAGIATNRIRWENGALDQGTIILL